MNHRHPLHRLELLERRPAVNWVGEAIASFLVVFVLPVLLWLAGAYLSVH